MCKIYLFRMYQYVWSVFLLALPLLSNAQQWSWSNQLKCDGAVVPYDIVTDNTGGIYVTGTYKTSTLYIKGDTLHNFGGDDCFIVKFNTSGAVQWLKRIGGTGDEESVSLVIVNNTIYVAGSFKSPKLYFTGASSLTNENNYDSFIASYDLNGNFISAVKVFGGTDVQRIKDMIYNATINNFAMVAQFKNQIKYTDLSGPVTVTAKSSKDLIIVKTDLTGIVQDTARYTTNPQNSILKDINRTFDNGYYLSGDLFGTVNFGGGNTITGHLPTTTADMLIVKVNQNLDFQWSRKGGSTGFDHANNAIADKYSNIYVTGKVEADVTFDSTATLQSHTILGFGGQDLFLAKYNKLGTLQWVKRKGDQGTDDGYGIIQRENLVQFCGNISGQVIFNNDTLSTSGITDINTGFAIFNTTGDEIGAQGIGGTGLDLGDAITFNINGNTLITGQFSSASMDIGDSTYTNISGTSDGFVGSFNYPMNAVFTTIDNIPCNGISSGRLIITPYFGIGPYQYNWSPNVLNHNDSLASDLGTGTYSVTITDALSHTATNSYNFTQPSAINLGAIQSDVSCYPSDGNSSDGSVNLNVTGGTVAGNYSYNWTAISGSGVNVTSEDQNTLTVGTYSVVVKDDNLCENSDTFTINQPDQITFNQSSITNEVIPPGNNGAIDLMVDGGNPSYTYVWSGPSGFSSTNEDINNLVGGSYTIIITDSKSCTSDTNFTVTNSIMLIAFISEKTDVDCKGNSTGSATVSIINGVGPYTYQWKNNLGNDVDGSNPSITNLPADIYFVTVTDNSDLRTATTSIQINEPSQVLSTTLLGTNVTCFGEMDGIADMSVTGGTLPYNFSWSNGAVVEDLLNVEGGTYFVTVTDNKGCTANNSVEITEPLAMDINISIDQPIQCNGDRTGRVTAAATGGTGTKTYQWDDPGNQNAQTATELGAGNYHVTATDLIGCTINGQVELLEPDPLVLSEEHQDISCVGLTNGQINLSVNGGTPTFNYDWSNGAITQDISGLDTGTYSVIVTDAHNCIAELSTSISEPEPISFQIIDLTNVTCADYADGIITITAVGGAGNYLYSTNGGLDYHADNTFTEVAAGEYTLKIFDGNDCESADSIVEITQPEGTTLVSTDITNATCNGYSDGSIAITASNPVGGLTYSIDNGITYLDNSGVFENLATGIYPLAIRDNDGCEQTFDDITITEPDPIILDTTIQHANGDQNGSIAVLATGGTSPYNYTLLYGAVDTTNTTGLFDNLIPEDYFTYVIDNNLCNSDTLSITILQTSTLITIYDAFSPNNDGRNDVWNIGNISLYPDCKVTIFNTWGNEVFSSKGYTEPWDGKYNDKDLPAGTYYYIIDLGDGSDPLSGPVSIVR
jgi:gliding motility-associated-like protein